MMITLLEKAINEVAKLSDDAQEFFARLILDELEDERRWDQSIAKSLPLLREMGREALAEHHAGLTEELDPDTL